MRRAGRLRFVALAAAAALVPVAGASPVAAAGIVVTSRTMLTQDDGACTLPEAIKAANTDTASGPTFGECPAGSGTDVITFSVSGTILTTRLPDITQPLTIDGAGTVTLNGQGGSSFFIANANPIHLKQLVFTNGRALFGGAFFVAGSGVVYLEKSIVSNNRAQQGGGIIVGNGGDLYVADSTISGNTASTSGGGIHLMGNGYASVTTSTVSGNTAPNGGGLYVSSNAIAAVHTSTIANNTATTTGGAVYAQPSGAMSLYGSTVALNTATTSTGGIYADPAASTDVQNSIVAGNTKGNTSTSAIDNSVSNIIGGSITGLLDPAGLQANGGPTKTVKLLSTATTALDHGNQTVCDATSPLDQRGQVRGSPCDIGAVERDRTKPTTTAPVVQLRSGTNLSGTGMRAVIRWTGTDGSGVGIARYQLQQSVNGGSYSTISSSLTGTSRTITLANGSDYRFRVRAFDRDANTGSYATSPTFKPRLVQNSSASVSYSGSWTTASSSSYSGGSVRYATQSDNETAAYAFTGSSVAFITTTAKSRGLVRVYIDNALVGLLDLYSASASYRRSLYAKSWPTSGAHTIRIENYGATGRARADIDAFAVIR